MRKAFSTLIDVADLNELINDSEKASALVIVDARFSLADPDYGRSNYEQAHLPDAFFADLDRDLSRPASAGEGRHPLPDIADFANLLGRFGVTESSQVVVYDDARGGVAGRFWWMLRHWCGHQNVAVLNGDYRAWVAAGLPVSTDIPPPQSAHFVARVNADAMIEIDAIERISADPVGSGWQLADARTAQRFRGEEEPIDPVAGHIPGSINLPLSENLDKNGRFLNPEQLRQRFAQLAGGTSEKVIHSCGSGVSACHNLLAMDIAGLTGSKLYVGSWSEWIRDPARAIGRDDD